MNDEKFANSGQQLTIWKADLTASSEGVAACRGDVVGCPNLWPPEAVEAIRSTGSLAEVNGSSTTCFPGQRPMQAWPLIPADAGFPRGCSKTCVFEVGPTPPASPSLIRGPENVVCKVRASRRASRSHEKVSFSTVLDTSQEDSTLLENARHRKVHVLMARLHHCV
jgi:hypothetical protein